MSRPPVERLPFRPLQVWDDRDADDDRREREERDGNAFRVMLPRK
jgi:hypothetical protein